MLSSGFHKHVLTAVTYVCVCMFVCTDTHTDRQIREEGAYWDSTGKKIPTNYAKYLVLIQKI